DRQGAVLHERPAARVSAGHAGGGEAGCSGLGCAPPAPMTIAVVAEKPAVARDLARVLGAQQRGDGYLHGGGYVVTWAIGHLVALAQPHQIEPTWKRWRLDTLPMLPGAWPLVVLPNTKDQFEVVRKILSSAKIEQVIAATDAG